jgi:hypothetical protein
MQYIEEDHQYLSDPMSASAGEGPRIDRVVAREGREQAKEWARRTAALYRAAVLDPEHFAHTGARRRQFIEAYIELKRFAERG